MDSVKFCKDPKVVTENDFFTSGLNIPGDTSSNKVGSNVTIVNVARIPGLNTCTRHFSFIKGTLRVGFVTSNPQNRHIAKVLNEGDVFVFPKGLIHYQQNIGHDNAVVIAALSSQNPGVITIANVVFGANPNITADILAKAFQLNKNTVQKLQARF
ncbi:Cupin type-1 domain-containing protein [Heracleum sosnowskyi]|uniref:Germin-like protein n=1 Tax=Heracleum sosnowskyi TaxID=360622 RepID=A0AAD8MGX3_9APIA|nr:Cupin type-1 domain-containing protein [Heracleum sosnowskyi]